MEHEMIDMVKLANINSNYRLNTQTKSPKTTLPKSLSELEGVDNIPPYFH